MRICKLKYALFLLLLVAGSIRTFGQLKNFENLTHFDDRKFHFGFYLGLNTMDYRMTNYNSVYENPIFKNNQNQTLLNQSIQLYGGKSSPGVKNDKPMPGFTVGGVINLRVSRDFDLRFTPGMSLGNKRLKYVGVNVDPLAGGQIGSGSDTLTYLSTPSAYIDLPLGFRYKGFRHHNLRPYVYSGLAYRIDLENKRISESVVHLNKTGSYAEVALGLDSYLEYFRFTAEFRFSYGLTNLIRHDTTAPLPIYGYIFKELNSNIFTLIFYFE